MKLLQETELGLLVLPCPFFKALLEMLDDACIVTLNDDAIKLIGRNGGGRHPH